jgi:Holliday junction resolvase RusA-like endonuclease
VARENVSASRVGYIRLIMALNDFKEFAHGITFFVPGEPQGKARPRSSVVTKADGSVARGKSGRAVIRHYTPKKTEDYEANIAVFYRQVKVGPPTIQPVILVLEIIHPIPESWPKWKRELVAKGSILPVTKPDADNILKVVKDALNGVAWIDDTQVVGTIKVKRYGAQSGVGVTIIPLAELPSTIKVVPR